MALKSKSQPRLRLTPRRILGGLLSVLAFSFLAYLSLFFYAKYTNAPVLANYLPAEETFLYAELRIDPANRDWQALRQVFSTVVPADVLQLTELGLPDSTGLLALAQERVGVAFLGESFDPQNFLLVLDTAEPATVLQYLEQQALAGEQLTTQTYVGVPVYSYPRSGEQVFALLGTDLLLASNRDVLQQVLAAARGSAERLVETEAYSAVIKRLDPRAVGFAYLSESATRQVFATRLGGIQNALATPFLELFQAGGAELIPTAEGVRLDTYFTLRPAYARQPLFAPLPSFESGLLDLLPANTQSFYASRNLAGQLEHFLTASEEFNSAFSRLAAGYLDTLTQEWLGQSTSFRSLVAPLLTSDALTGTTESGGRFFVLTGDNLAEDWSDFATALKTGRLATRTQTVILPDGTTGRQLTAAPTLTTQTTTEYNDVEITSLVFRGQGVELHYALTDELLLAATELATLEQLLDQAATKDSTALAEIVAIADLRTEEVFYRQLSTATQELGPTASTLRLLAPFRYLLAGKWVAADGLTLTFFFGL